MATHRRLCIRFGIGGILLILLGISGIDYAHGQVDLLAPSSTPRGFPDNDGASGRMLGAAAGLSTLGEPPETGTVLNVHFRIGKADPDGELRIMLFDADLFSDFDDDASGFFDYPGIDEWDDRDTTIYQLYPDVDRAGNSTIGLIHSLVADRSMDNTWINFFAGLTAEVEPALALDPEAFWYPLACEIDGEFCYFHLVLRWYDRIDKTPIPIPFSVEGNALNTFKPATNGEPFLAAGTSIGFIGYNENSRLSPVPTRPGVDYDLDFDGTLSLRVLVSDERQCALDIYDGDTDYCGSSPDAGGTCRTPGFEEEKDDFNTPPNAVGFVPGEPRPFMGFYPFLLSAATLPEGVHPGDPPDDDPRRPKDSISPPVFYTVSGPVSGDPEDGTYRVVNTNPSGDREMELFRIASNRTDVCPDPELSPYDPDGEYDQTVPMGQAPEAAPDEIVDGIGPGFHQIVFTGLDFNNLNFLNVNVDAFSSPDLLDYGDAPDSYSTLKASGGPSHVLDARLFMGNDADPIDTESDGVPGAGADGDDRDLTDDEDGVADFGPLDIGLVGMPYLIEVSVKNDLAPGTDANLVGWIDFDGNESFDLDESATAAVSPGDTEATLNFMVPADITAGDTYVRLRLSTDAINGSTPGGEASDGEVEDYLLIIDRPSDYGDAPDSYSTLKASGGPSHRLDARLFMGNDADPIDTESDGAPGAGADGDDRDLTDDEDGVADFGPLDIGLIGMSYLIEVSVKNDLAPGTDANLVGWIDFDGNESFDLDESATAAVSPGDTAATLNFMVPADTTAGDTYVRLRLSTDAINGSTPGGEASDGEVEDYPLTIKPCIPCETGITDITLKLVRDHYRRQDSREWVRIFQGIRKGNEHYIQTGPNLFKVGDLTNGQEVSITGIDPNGNPLLVVVKGPNHKKPYVKVVIPIDCKVAIGRRYPRSRNYWIKFKVTDLGIDGIPICESEHGGYPAHH